MEIPEGTLKDLVARRKTDTVSGYILRKWKDLGTCYDLGGSEVIQLNSTKSRMAIEKSWRK